MYCVKCGAQVPNEAKFCTKCGGAMKAPQPNVETAPVPTPGTPKKKGKLPLILAAVVGGLVLVAVAVVAVLLLGRGDKAQTAEPPDQSPGLDVSVVAPVATPAPTPEPTPAPEPKPTAEEVKALYEAAFLASYGDDAGVLLVDMDHDGVMEMIVTHWGEMTSAGEALAGETAFDLYAIRNDAVKLMLTDTVSDIHAYQGHWTLLQKGDFGYLMLDGWYVSGQSGESDSGPDGPLVYVLGKDDTLREVTQTERQGVDLENGIMLIAPYDYYKENSYFHAPITAGEARAMGSDEQGRVNLFLSNFSEQGFEDYERGVSPGSQIIDFSFWQLRRNANVVTANAAGGESLAADKLETAAQRFFGVIPARQSTDLFTYADGVYSWRGADGAPSYMTVADSMVPLSDGTHQVAFTVYFVDEYEMYGTLRMDDLYALTPAQVAELAFLAPRQTGTAILEDATHKGKPSYHLVKYTLEG